MGFKCPHTILDQIVWITMIYSLIGPLKSGTGQLHQVCIVIPVPSLELITLSARPLGDPTEEEVVNLILGIIVTLGNCGVVCPTSTLVNQRIAKKSHLVCSNVSYRIQQLTL